MPRGARAALVALVAAGVALRLWQYLANASLWIDEIALAQNVLYWPLAHLLREPLSLDQVSPPGFLAVSKGVTWVIGNSERALRLFPLLGGLLSLLLFPKLSRRFQPPWVTVFATGLFAVSPSLIGFSADFNPYSTDVTFAILLTLAAFGLDASSSRARWLWASLLGVVGPWFSQTAVFVIVGLAGALFGLTLVDRPRFLTWPMISLLSVWTLSCLFAFVTATHRVPRDMNLYLRRFWHPELPRVGMLLFIAVAALLLWLRSKSAAAILLAPVLVTLAAAAAHVYPFQGRTIVFLA